MAEMAEQKMMIEKDILVEMMNEIPTVENMDSHNSYGKIANQFIISGKGFRLFQSCSSPIAMIKGGKVYIFRNWDYSRTTGKYRNMFLGETKAETLKNLKDGKYIAVDFEV